MDLKNGDSLMDKESIKHEIVSSLQPLQPEKIILFGSYASGNRHDFSDVDIYVVSKEDYLPQNYAQNMHHYKKYSRALKQLKQKIPVDMIVHTRKMNRIFEQNGSSFSKQILEQGERLL